MTPQEIFNTVATHLFNQGHKALLPNSFSCAYRAQDGKKCAIGCLIPDEAYNPRMECKDIDHLLSYANIPTWFHGNKTLLRSLQSVHDTINLDGWVSTDAMRHELRTVATNFSLNPSILETLSFNDR